MRTDERLADFYEAIAAAGIPALVLGGHAARFYGVERTTVDYDFHIALDDWAGLPRVLSAILGARGASVTEGPSWRPSALRRFVVGRLPDGREELLECWRRNHLLAPFPDLHSRRVEGTYGGRRVAFLGLPDLLRSKETEREDDWRDIEVLEEILDEQRHSRANEPDGVVSFLGDLRSRRGFERALGSGFFHDGIIVAAAWNRAVRPVTRAFLAPYVPQVPDIPSRVGEPIIEEILNERLRGTEPGSSRHLALVEVVRRLYKRDAMEADRKDKIRESTV